MERNGQAKRGRMAAIGGAVVAAFAASACCVGPLVLAALGVGGAGALAALGRYRSWILAGTAGLLALGFYLTYRKPKGQASGACGCEAPRRGRGRSGRISLWLATALVGIVAASPSLLAWIAPGAEPAGAPPSTEVALATVMLRVEGMDCAACAVPLRRALEAVGGFHDLALDLPGGTVAVTYEPAPERVKAYVDVIDALGFEASLPGGKP